MLFWIWLLASLLAFALAAIVGLLYTLRALKETLVDFDEYEKQLLVTLKAYKRAVRSSEKHRISLEKLVRIQDQMIENHKQLDATRAAYRDWVRGGAIGEIPS